MRESRHNANIGIIGIDARTGNGKRPSACCRAANTHFWALFGTERFTVHAVAISVTVRTAPPHAQATTTAGQGAKEHDIDTDGREPATTRATTQAHRIRQPRTVETPTGRLYQPERQLGLVIGRSFCSNVSGRSAFLAGASQRKDLRKGLRQRPGSAWMPGQWVP